MHCWHDYDALHSETLVLHIVGLEEPRRVRWMGGNLCFE
jgi:hypothetical protein